MWATQRSASADRVRSLQKKSASFSNETGAFLRKSGQLPVATYAAHFSE